MSNASAAASSAAPADDTVVISISSQLVARHANRMKKTEPTHDDIVRLVGARASMSDSQYVANTVVLAHGHPLTLLRVREAEHAEKFVMSKRKNTMYAYRESKKKEPNQKKEPPRDPDLDGVCGGGGASAGAAASS